MFTNVIASSLTLYGKHHFSILLNINLLFYISRVSGWFYLRIRMTVKTCAPSGARARYMTCEAFDLCARRFLHIFVIKPRANAKTIQRFTNIFSNTYPSFYLLNPISQMCLKLGLSWYILCRQKLQILDHRYHDYVDMRHEQLIIYVPKYFYQHFALSF